MTAPISNHDGLITRRSILIGAAFAVMRTRHRAGGNSYAGAPPATARLGRSMRGSATVYFITRSTVACEQDCEQAKRASISTAQ